MYPDQQMSREMTILHSTSIAEPESESKLADYVLGYNQHIYRTPTVCILKYNLVYSQNWFFS